MKGNDCVFKRIKYSQFKYELYRRLSLLANKSKFLVQLKTVSPRDSQGNRILKLTPLCERMSNLEDVTDDTWTFMACILMALIELHSVGYYHRDIRLVYFDLIS